jgi:dihydrofolate synthase/folylpolyglutamate synthase
MLPRTPEEGLAFFRALSPSTIRLGLDRVERTLAALGNPERRYRAIHVAGTNGKGSTCAFCEAALRAQGLRTGLYTSPHLVRVNERIRVAGEEISDHEMGEGVLEVLTRHPEAATELTYFEFGTVLAFWHFAKAGVEVAVIETGLGGRLDATSTCKPDVTAVTQIAFDHKELLGDTLPKIAFEKAGIFKPGVPAVVSENPPEVVEVFTRRAAELGCELIIEGRPFTLSLSKGPRAGESNTELSYRGPIWSIDGIQLGLRGPHQLHNAATAIAILEQLSKVVPLTPDAVKRGLAQTRWPGRLEEVARDPLVVLDGAHNPAGIESLLASLDAVYPGRRVHLVFGVLGDKDFGPMIDRLFPRCASADVAALDSPRSLDPSKYLDRARALCPQVDAHGSLAQALASARARATGTDLVLCAGSLFLVGGIRGLLGVD